MVIRINFQVLQLILLCYASTSTYSILTSYYAFMWCWRRWEKTIIEWGSDHGADDYPHTLTWCCETPDSDLQQCFSLLGARDDHGEVTVVLLVTPYSWWLERSSRWPAWSSGAATVVTRAVCGVVMTWWHDCKVCSDSKDVVESWCSGENAASRTRETSIVIHQEELKRFTTLLINKQRCSLRLHSLARVLISLLSLG